MLAGDLEQQDQVELHRWLQLLWRWYLLWSASPTITGNIIELNIATYGGGVFWRRVLEPGHIGQHFQLEHGDVRRRHLLADYASPTISNNTISGTGHGIYCDVGLFAVDLRQHDQ